MSGNVEEKPYDWKLGRCLDSKHSTFKQELDAARQRLLYYTTSPSSILIQA